MRIEPSVVKGNDEIVITCTPEEARLMNAALRSGRAAYIENWYHPFRGKDHDEIKADLLQMVRILDNFLPTRVTRLF